MVNKIRSREVERREEERRGEERRGEERRGEERRSAPMSYLSPPLHALVTQVTLGFSV